MTPWDMVFLVACFLLLLIALGLVADHWMTPQARDHRADQMCRCGVRGGAQRHVHGPWVDRDR